MAEILLIQPPALKAAEPPLALAVLLAHLQKVGIRATAIDANLDAYLYLLDGERLRDKAGTCAETSLKRALNHRDDALQTLRSGAGQNFARYNTAVRYLNRLLAVWNTESEKITLGDYQHSGLSPFAPQDLDSLARGEVHTLFHDYFTEKLLPQLKSSGAGIVGLSINYLHQALPAFELAGLIRAALPDVLLVAGGGLITSWQEPLIRQQLRLSPFDHVIFGPAEAPLTALATGTVAPDYTLTDSTEISFSPDFGFARIGEYLSPQPILPLTASRGCYWRRCLFCPEAASPVHPYCTFKTEELPQTMRQLADEHGISHIQLTDNAIPVNMLKRLAAHPEQLAGINWFGFVRFEKSFEEIGFVQRLAQSGCKMLQLGLESGSQRVLDRLQKGIKLASVARILANLRQAGIATFVYIMLGTPGETEADALQTLAFLEQHADEIGFLNLSIMNLPRASGLLDNPQQFGITATEEIATDNPLGLYQRFHSDSDWNRASTRRFLNQRLLGSACSVHPA